MSASPSNPSSPYGRRSPRWEHRPAEEPIPGWLRVGICAGLALYLAYSLVNTALD